MAEVLSQSEIDALLAAVSTGTVETAETGNPSDKPKADWIAYDLTSQEKIVRGRLAALQGIHERFSRLFRITLSHALKKSVTVTPGHTDFIRFSDYLSNILLPTSLNVLHMPKLKGYMIGVVSSKLAYALIDAYYGGTERPFSKIGGREEFTQIETSMIQKVAALAIHDLQEAWKPNYDLELEFQRTESNPHFVGCIHGSELVAVATFEIEFETLSGPFVLILQLKALEAIQQHLAINITSEINAEEELWRAHWFRELMELKFNVRAELGNTTASLKTIQSWKTGDTLLLGQDIVEPLEVLIEEVPKIKGLMGVYRGNRAIRLTENM